VHLCHDDDERWTTHYALLNCTIPYNILHYMNTNTKSKTKTKTETNTETNTKVKTRLE